MKEWIEKCTREMSETQCSSLVLNAITLSQTTTKIKRHHDSSHATSCRLGEGCRRHHCVERVGALIIVSHDAPAAYQHASSSGGDTWKGVLKSRHWWEKNEGSLLSRRNQKIVGVPKSRANTHFIISPAANNGITFSAYNYYYNEAPFLTS